MLFSAILNQRLNLEFLLVLELGGLALQRIESVPELRDSPEALPIPEPRERALHWMWFEICGRLGARVNPVSMIKFVQPTDDR